MLQFADEDKRVLMSKQQAFQDSVQESVVGKAREEAKLDAFVKKESEEMARNDHDKIRREEEGRK
jgi:hypothetical protein